MTLGLESPEMLRILKVIETMTEEMSIPEAKEMDRGVADRMNTDKVSKKLFETLVMLTEGEAEMIICGVTTQDGILA